MKIWVRAAPNGSLGIHRPTRLRLVHIGCPKLRDEFAKDVEEL
jgi:hypothetical protein